MKKTLIALIGLAVMASVATAGVGITWQPGWGGYTHDAPNVTDSNNGILDSYSVLWQLIYAGANNTIEPPDLTRGAQGYIAATSDDSVWATRTLAQIVLPATTSTAPEDGTTWQSWMNSPVGDATYVDNTWTTAGFVYQRVFENAAPNEYTGAWYFDSRLFGYDETWTSSLPPEPFNPEANPGQAGFQPDQYIAPVPEPATMGLLGLGALALAIRRRRS